MLDARMGYAKSKKKVVAIVDVFALLQPQMMTIWKCYFQKKFALEDQSIYSVNT